MDAQTLASLPPHLLAQYLRDPQSMIAQEFITTGTDTSPVQHWAQGLARMAKAGLGGYMAQKLRDQYNQKAGNVANERQRAMALAMGRPAETQKYGDTTINWNEQKPNFMAATSTLVSPDNQDLANTFLGAKINSDQLANQQDFLEAQQGRSFEQQKQLAEMTAERQTQAQNAMLNRMMELEKFKLQNDPQKLLYQQLFGAGITPPAGAQSFPVGDMSTPTTQEANAPMTGNMPMISSQDALANAALGKLIGNAPEGMMWTRTPQGIGVAPVTNPKMTDEQSKAVGFATRLMQADQYLNDQKILAAGTSGKERAKDFVPLIGNYIVSEDYQKYDQATRDFVNALLRRESGAAISPAEFENARLQYFPQPGDLPGTIQQKAQARKIAIENMKLSSGPGKGMVKEPQTDSGWSITRE